VQLPLFRKGHQGQKIALDLPPLGDARLLVNLTVMLTVELTSRLAFQKDDFDLSYLAVCSMLLAASINY